MHTFIKTNKHTTKHKPALVVTKHKITCCITNPDQHCLVLHTVFLR